MSESRSVNVVVTYGDTKVEFKGAPEAVLESVLRFIAKEIPNIDLARKISLNYEASELIQSYAEYVKITPEGPRVITEGKKLSDKEVVAIQLVACRIASEVGRSDSPDTSVQDLQLATAMNPKSLSSRLSELSKLGYVQKVDGEQGIRYRITTQGIHWLNSTLLKRIRP
jgi:predicted transcriptional regulator